MPYNDLSAEEERVIVYKGTERPFTGEYETLYSPGTFICRRCNNPLYSAEPNSSRAAVGQASMRSTRAASNAVPMRMDVAPR